MSIKNGVFRLAERADTNAPIDQFFRSLAVDCGDAAIGVILAGTSGDGLAGLEAIRAHGGISFGQDHAPAKYSDTSDNAVSAGILDFALPPLKIAAELLRIARSKPLVAVQRRLPLG